MQSVAERKEVPKSILVVDDHEDIRAMMRLTIENFGYTVIEAAGPYDAIEKAQKFQPDLILMDIGLPLLDGLSTAKLIIDLENCGQIPIVAVTAYRDIRDQASKAGCVDVLYKPIEPERLENLLHQHLDGS
ncbi:MAG: response regulator [Pyrinomonadaceae bacterium]